MFNTFDETSIFETFSKSDKCRSHLDASRYSEDGDYLEIFSNRVDRSSSFNPITEDEQRLLEEQMGGANRVIKAPLT